MRRGDGIYTRKGTFYLDFRHAGKRHVARLGRHISKSAARELEVATRSRILKGEAGIGGTPRITVADYAARWLRQVAPHLAPKTLAGYQGLLTSYILPTLGPAQLGSVDRSAVKALLAKYRGAGLSKNTVRLIRATLSVLCADAIDDGFLTVNPAQGLSRRGRPGPGTVSQAERQAAIRPLSLAQLEAFLQVAEGRAQGHVVYLTLADAGLRPSEALALRWQDLDVADRVLHVERSLSGTSVKLTKTGARRKVELTPRLLAALERWQATQEAEALAAGREPAPWMFHDAQGRPLDLLVVARRFRLLCARAGLPRYRLYDLRHTYATHLLALGAPITYVSGMLGHAKPTTTLQFYAHWLPDPEPVWAGKLEAARQVGADSQRGSQHAGAEDQKLSGSS